MNKFAALGLAVLSCTTDLLAQGTFMIDNSNGHGDAGATSFGLFFDWNGTPYTSSPINVSVYGGSTPTNMVLIATLTGSNALVNLGAGKYKDPSSTSYIVPGVTLRSNAWLRVRAWRGPAASYEQASVWDRFNPTSGAYPAPAVPCDDPGPVPFQNPTGFALAPKLDGMPALGIGGGLCITQPGSFQPPTNQVVLRGGTAAFYATWWDGVYPSDWRLNGVIIPGTYSQGGPRAKALVITNVQPANAGIYTYHAYGCGCYYPDVSASATLTVVNNTLGLELVDHPLLTIAGPSGQTFNIQSTTNLAQSNAWITLTNLTLTTSTTQWVDLSVTSPPAGDLQRYYQAVPLP